MTAQQLKVYLMKAFINTNLCICTVIDDKNDPMSMQEIWQYCYCKNSSKIKNAGRVIYDRHAYNLYLL